MSLLAIILPLAIAGLIVWVVLQIPMPIQFRNVILAVSVIILLLWVAQFFGANLGLPRVRLK